jgi:hypothetical protein
MAPRKPTPQKPKTEAEPPLEVEGGEMDQETPAPGPEPAGGMISEGGAAGGGASGDGDRPGGMIGEG